MNFTMLYDLVPQVRVFYRGAMSPNAQEFSQIDHLLQTIAGLSSATLIIVLVLALVAFGIVLVRALTGRDKPMNTAVTSLSLIVSQLTTAAEQREKDNKAWFAQIEERNAKADERWIQVIDGFTSAITNMDSRLTVGHGLLETVGTHLDAHDLRAERGINDLMAAVNKVNDAVTEIKLVLPLLARRGEMDAAVGRLDMAIKRLEEAKQECIEGKKRESNEHPVLPLPVEDKPEDASALTPGSEAA